MVSYVAYGLGICSALPLPELVPREAMAEVVVRLGKVERFSTEEAAAGTIVRATAGEVYLAWESVGAFAVRGGHEITVEPAPGVAEQTLRHFLLGPALAVLLQQRGRLVLHASAVAVHGGGVAFLGGPRWGKSTMAAVMHAHGHDMVTDDVLAIDLQGEDGPLVSPGVPQLNLWPDVIAALGDPLESRPRIHPGLDKRARRLTAGFSREALPLRHLYVLAEGPVAAIDPLSPQEALIELVRHSYGVRSLHTMGASSIASHFRQCVSLAAHVPLHRLQRTPSLRELAALVRRVEESLAHDSTWHSSRGGHTP